MRIAAWIGGGLILLIGVAVALLLTVDVNRFKPEIIAEVEELTGRQLTIAGDLKLAILPRPAAQVKGVALANMKGGSRPVMLQVGEFSAALDIGALLGGKVKVDSLTLSDVDLLLERDSGGRGNWEFGTPPAKVAGAVAQAETGKAQTQSGFALPVLSSVTMKNIRLAYKESPQAAIREAHINDFSLKAGADENLVARLAAKLDGHDIALSGSFGSLAEMMAPTKAWPVKAAVSVPAADLVVNIDGSLKEPLAAKGYALKVTVDAPDIAKVAALAKQPAPSFGPLKFSGLIQDQGAEPSLSDMLLTLGAEDFGRLVVRGGVQRMISRRGLQLNIEFNTPNARSFAARFGAEVPQAVPVNFKTDIRDTAADRYTLSSVTAAVATSDLAGNGELFLGGTRPNVKLDIASKSLDLLPLLEGASAPKTASGSQPSPVGAKPGTAKANKLFSDDPLPLDSLMLADADVKFRAGEFKAPKLSAKDVTVNLLLKDGFLTVKPFGLGLSGGTINGDLSLNSKSKALGVKLDTRNLSLSDYLKAEKVTDILNRGAALDMSVDVTSQGGSVAALMAGLNGKALVKVGEGELKEEYLNFLGASFLDLLGSLGKASAKTKLECVVGGFDIRNGEATPKAILVETGRLSVTGEGKIDLGRELINMKLVPSSRDAAIGAVVPPVNVNGALADPSVSPDAMGVAKGVVGAVAGIALLGPAAILSPLAGGGKADSGQEACAKAAALAEGRNVPGPAKSAPASGAAPPQNQAPAKNSNPVENLGRSLGNLFKR